MTNEKLDALLVLLNELERSNYSTTVVRLARSLFQKVTRIRYG